MMTTDLSFIGRSRSEAITAAALAGRVYLVSVILGTGLLAASASFAAQAFGSDDLSVLRRSLRGLGRRSGAVISGNPYFHERGQSTRAGPVHI